MFSNCVMRSLLFFLLGFFDVVASETVGNSLSISYEMVGGMLGRRIRVGPDEVVGKLCWTACM